MLSIWKFGLPLSDRVEIEMPHGAQVLSVGVQRGNPCLWALVDAHRRQVHRTFYVHGTGHPVIDPDALFIGTIQLHGGALIFHVFEPKEATP